ncbi:MAG: VCBS repeat-containing protein [Acidobacteria bacterium]|nr:VCBS repeat-containing protein [Acidobacteriota bacterium]MBI3655280.1 VCBS repeat-containing protein [Acidobacteriota bacterium]
MLSPRRLTSKSKVLCVLLVYLALSHASAFGQRLSFSSRNDYLSRGTPFGIATGNFNNLTDMFPDLAIVNTDSNNVSILLGDGNGGFTTGTAVTVGGKPKGIVAVDLNGDNKLDLAVTNSQTGNVSLLLGDGRGGFTPRLPIAGVQSPGAIAAGDFNGDGVMDLVVANTGSRTISVILGRPNGSYAVSSLPVGTEPQSIAVGRLTRGRNLDIVVANSGSDSLTILLGRGNGTFLSPRSIMLPPGSAPRSVVLGDFNGDSNMDIAVAAYGTRRVTVFPGRGDGTFFLPQQIPLLSRPTTLAVSDLNQDRNLDLVVCAVEDLIAGDLPAVSILLGNGDLSFTSAPDLSVGFGSMAVVTQDFNRDGIPDLAATSSGAGMVSVWRGVGDGTFVSDVSFASGQSPSGIVSGDLNGDGKADLVTANFGSESLSVFLNAGGGTFSDPVNYPLGPPSTRLDPTAVALGDFNGDGFLDVAVANAYTNSVAVLLGRGNGTFITPAIQYPVGYDPRSIAIADLNGDAFLDIVTGNFNGNGLPNEDSVSVLLGRGNGTFFPAINYRLEAGSKPRALVVVDVDGDGWLDVLTANFGSASLSILRGSDTGLVTPPVTFSVSNCGQGPHGITVGYFNGDTALDLAIGVAGTYDVANDKVAVLLGKPESPGTFTLPASCLQVGLGPTAVITDDFDLDGKADIVVVNSLSNSVAVLLGNGDGTFRSAQFFGVGAGPLFMAMDDFDLDGQWDLAVANAMGSTVSVLYNTTVQ